MNRVKHRIYVLEFDVWEPFTRICDNEVDNVVRYAKEKLSHCGGVKLSLKSEGVVNEKATDSPSASI